MSGKRKKIKHSKENIEENRVCKRKEKRRKNVKVKFTSKKSWLILNYKKKLTTWNGSRIPGHSVPTWDVKNLYSISIVLYWWKFIFSWVYTIYTYYIDINHCIGLCMLLTPSICQAALLYEHLVLVFTFSTLFYKYLKEFAENCRSICHATLFLWTFSTCF